MRLSVLAATLSTALLATAGSASAASLPADRPFQLTSGNECLVADGESVRMAACSEAAEQRFVHDDAGRLVSTASSLCLDPAITLTIDPAGLIKAHRLRMLVCSSDSRQRWETSQVNGSTFTLRVADLNGDGRNNDAEYLHFILDELGTMRDYGPVTTWRTIDPSAHSLTVVAADKVCSNDRLLCLRGEIDADGTHIRGAVKIETPLGDWGLENADLTIDPDGPSLRGSAEVGLPVLGVLAPFESVRARASVFIGFGDDGELSLAGRPFAPRPDRFYVAVDFEAAADTTLAGQTVFSVGESTSLLVEPTTPIIYADGLIASSLASMLKLGGIEAFGLSLDDRACIPYTTANPMLDRTGATQHVGACGNLMLQASGDIKIVGFDGTLFADLDADGDGTTVFEGQPRDFILAGDLTTSIGPKASPWKVPLGTTSFFYEAAVGTAGRLRVSNVGGRDVVASMFEGSPLAKLLSGPASRSYAIADDQGAWMRFELDHSLIGGWSVGAVSADVIATDSAVTIQASGRLSLPGNELAVTGTVDSSGAFSLTATHDLRIADMSLQRATISLGNAGVTIASAATLSSPGLDISAVMATRRNVDVTGPAEPVGPTNFGLAGSGTIKLQGRTLASGRVALTTQGARVVGWLGYAGARFAIDGQVSASGFSLTSSIEVHASKRINVGVTRVRVGADGHAVLSVSNGGFAVNFIGDTDPGDDVTLAINSTGEISFRAFGKRVHLDLI